MNLLQRGVWAVAALFGTAACAGALPAFNDVATALAQGKRVTVVLDLAQCQHPGAKPGPSIKAGLSIASYMNFGSRIVFADPHFTLPPKRNFPVVEFVRYELNDRGHLTLTSTVFRLPGYKKIQASTIGCELGKGVSFFG